MGIARQVENFKSLEGQVYVVLGMHRSATSLVAFALERCGIAMYGGRFHCEDTSAMRINDQILSAAGGSWDSPPSYEAIMAKKDQFSRTIAQFVNKRYRQARGNGRGLWGFKDPRTALTFDLWAPYLIRPILINVIRHPEEVARSLQRRNGFSIDFGIQLAKEYNRRILRIMNQYANGGRHG